MEPVEMFKKLRDVSDDVVKAMESSDSKALESSIGRFIIVMFEFNSMGESIGDAYKTLPQNPSQCGTQCGT